MLASVRMSSREREKLNYRDDPHLKINPTIIDFVSVDVQSRPGKKGDLAFSQIQYVNAPSTIVRVSEYCQRFRYNILKTKKKDKGMEHFASFRGFFSSFAECNVLSLSLGQVNETFHATSHILNLTATTTSKMPLVCLTCIYQLSPVAKSPVTSSPH